MILIKFNDPQLRQHCEKVVSIMTGLPDELRPVCGLLDAWHWFRLIEGDQSPKVREAIRHLTDPQMRAALKAWYARHSSANEAAEAFRQILQQATNEDLPLGK